MFSKISNYVTDMIYDTLPGIEPERREVIEYGVYMTVSELVKLIVTIIVSAFIGVVPHVLCVTAVFGVQRMLLGGVHAKSHWGCMISHSAIVFSIVALSFVSYVDRLYLMILIVPFSYITAYKYAPADLPQKPVKSKRQRKQLRAGGYMLMAALFTAAYFLDRTWSNLILFTCFIQSALMTPLAYRITKNKYGKEEASA
ncbi:MAG: accessory gene regulator ArgB-like protein [Acetivibrionales bacterium]